MVQTQNGNSYLPVKLLWIHLKDILKKWMMMQALFLTGMYVAP
jgi:hypothetical protein